MPGSSPCRLKAVPFLLTAILALTVSPVAAQGGPPRIVIGTHVACREAPDTASPVIVRFALGDPFQARARRQTDTGAWYHAARAGEGSSSGCWIYGPLTTAWDDRGAALLAVADHVIARTGAPLEDYMAVEELLRHTPAAPGSRTLVMDTSPLLQLRRIQVLEAAAETPWLWPRRYSRAPAQRAWIEANEDVLRYHEPAGAWVVPADVYWRLWERHRDTRWAEEMAWAAARALVPGDECDAGCILGRIQQTFARYWEAYPDGRWVDEAVTEAAGSARFAVRIGCDWSEPDDVAARVLRLRTGLGPVSAPGRDDLLSLLEAVVDGCAGADGR